MAEGKRKGWYYSAWAVITALLCAGPLALPLLFLSPKFRLSWKILIAVIIIALTVWLVVVSGRIYVDLLRTLDEMKQVYGLK